MASTITNKFDCANLKDLLDAINEIVQESGADPSTIYLHNPHQDALRFALVRNTLTDGSHTWDTIVTPIDG